MPEKPSEKLKDTVEKTKKAPKDSAEDLERDAKIEQGVNDVAEIFGELREESKEKELKPAIDIPPIDGDIHTKKLSEDRFEISYETGGAKISMVLGKKDYKGRLEILKAAKAKQEKEKASREDEGEGEELEKAA